MKGIILIHEFWGVNGQMNKVAERLRAEGFEVMLADLYKGKVAQNIEEARAMKDAVKDDEALLVLKNCVEEFNKKGIAPENVAIWGFCMGGSFSFLSACSGMKIGAYIIYYGSRISDDRDLISKISSPIMGVFGGLDKAIPRDIVSRFGQALGDLKKTNEIDIYDDADHAFFNDERASYNPKAAAEAWQKTLAFLNIYLNN